MGGEGEREPTLVRGEERRELVGLAMMTALQSSEGVGVGV
jgi:hypothetical protein